MMTSHITLIIIFCSLLSIQPVIVNTEGINFPKLLASQTKLEFFDFMDIRLELKRFTFMKIKIPDCEKIIHDADKIDTLMDDVSKMISEYQKCYKKAVEEAYRLNPPFSPQVAPETRLDSDLDQIDDMITHSVILQSNELLKQYIIKPVSEKKISLNRNIISKIDSLLQDAEDPFEEWCIQWLKKELEKILQK